MYNFKNSKGISMVSLVVTVIVIIIISMVGVNFGINGIKESNDAKLVSELQIVQHAILEQYTKYKITKEHVYLVGNKITDEEANQIANEIGVVLVDIPDTYSNQDYYRLDKASLTAIGIQDSTDEYIINYISGEVINITQKKTSKDVPLYTKANSF